MTARQLKPGQRAELYVYDLATDHATLVTQSGSLLFEAPNWTPDGTQLIVNGDGVLHRVPATGGELTPIRVDGLPELNNDHVLSPDGATAYVSANDGHLYAVDLASHAARPVSNDHGPHFHHYLHGVSPDDAELAYIGLELLPAGATRTNVYTLPTRGGADTQLTEDDHADDGCEYGPDGEWIYFNSERAATAPGHAQLFRMRRDGSDVRQLTFDERVNWFPHPSPDGERVVYLSFPPGTQGHPPDLTVRLRLLEHGRIRELVELPGGQGTINVPSWAPDGTRFAYVAYPFG
ncbi:MAG: PD40 domain-containing protein [Micropruina sp.]|nr:PD40 domain-containing protein [Micropruina sp.]